MFKFLVGLVAGALLGGTALVGVQATRLDRKASFTQPSSITYADGRTHTATVYRRRSYSSPILGVDQYEVVLGSDPTGSYGHRVRLAATDAGAAPVSVRWDRDGALIVYPAGYRVRVPAAAFQGGR